MKTMIRVSGLLLALSAAGCTASRDEPPASGAAAGSAAPLVASEARAAQSAAPVSTKRFAGLPDRGELIGYARGARVLRDGARNWHRIGVSEAHARAAVAGGSLQVLSPSGQVLRYAYERQVENDGGDWTWIGRAVGGREQDKAVITFGADAVFGTIAVPGQAELQLATRDGAAWLADTDRQAAMAAERAAATPVRADYLVPPVVAGAAAAAAAAAPTDEPMRLIDVVIGYTSLAPRSTVMTELNSEVNRVNTIFQSSGVKARLRLVNATYVNYSANDASDQVTLEKLTGTPGVPVDPAFAGLRSLREQSGGDLVVLVRQFASDSTPGCGAAWLLGANLKGIDAGDAAYGYSVVKSGNSACSATNFAHQIGHNLGAQHDRASASANGSVEYGAYPYSFGYRGNGFRTVMALPESLSPQWMFSSPRRTCSNSSYEACGTAEADNARTLQQTIPIVSQFRRKQVPGGFTRYDSDGDGVPELFWRNKREQMFAYWGGMRASQSSPAYPMIAAYDVAAIADFTGDGRADVLWKSDADSYLVLWVATDDGFEQRGIGGYEPGMRFVGVGDFNGDERFDLLWRSTITGQMKVWTMQGAAITGQASAPMPGWFDILGVGDFNGDGYSDVVYADSGSLYLYANNAMAFSGQVIGGRPGGWKYLGAADFNGDGRDDMFWNSPADDVMSYWLMDGNRIAGNPTRALPKGRVLIGVRRQVSSVQGEWMWDDAPERRVVQDLSLGGLPISYSEGYPEGWQVLPLR